MTIVMDFHFSLLFLKMYVIYIKNVIINPAFVEIFDFFPLQYSFQLKAFRVMIFLFSKVKVLVKYSFFSSLDVMI